MGAGSGIPHTYKWETNTLSLILTARFLSLRVFFNIFFINRLLKIEGTLPNLVIDLKKERKVLTTYKTRADYK